MAVFLRRAAIGLLLAASLGSAAAADMEEYIVLKKSGGFAAGGRVAANATGDLLSCDHGYMEYFIPARPRKTSLVMWHSSSTQVFQNRWDGGEGFKDMFLRRNYPVYLWDGPRVGRADWGCHSYTYVPEYYDHWNFVAWDFGPEYGNWWNDTQFPRDDPQAWDQAMRARYNKFNTVENVQLQSDAAAIAADSGKAGDSIVYLTSAAAGPRALLTATKSNSSHIKAIVAYECIGFVFPDTVTAPNYTSPDNFTLPTGFLQQAGFGPFLVPLDDFKKLANISIQFVWADHREAETNDYIKTSHTVAKLINSYGGKAEVVMLGEAGLKGSSHLPMADMSNGKLAKMLDGYLEKHNLDGYKEDRA